MIYFDDVNEPEMEGIKISKKKEIITDLLHQDAKRLSCSESQLQHQEAVEDYLNADQDIDGWQ